MPNPPADTSHASTGIPAELLAEPRFEEAGVALRSVDNALHTAARLSRLLEEMQLVCRLEEPDVDSMRIFEEMVASGNQMLAELAESPVNAESVTLKSSNDMEFEVNMQMPRLVAIPRTFYTSLAPDMELDERALQHCVGQRRQLRLHRDATIQGIRIFARYPYDPAHWPQRAINSLSNMTGTRVSMIGNTLFPPLPTRVTGIPLSNGEMAINMIDIPDSDGSPDDLVEKINLTSDQHGVHAVLMNGNRLSLQRLDGAEIRLSVRSQSAAILSGYHMGVLTHPSNYSGIPVWFEQPSAQGSKSGHRIEFDSADTGLALTGQAVQSLQLNAFEWKDLSCKDRRSAQISWLLLEQMKAQLVLLRRNCRKALHSTIAQIENVAERCFVLFREYLQQLQLSWVA